MAFYFAAFSRRNHPTALRVCDKGMSLAQMATGMNLPSEQAFRLGCAEGMISLVVNRIHRPSHHRWVGSHFDIPLFLPKTLQIESRLFSISGNVLGEFGGKQFHPHKITFFSHIVQRRSDSSEGKLKHLFSRLHVLSAYPTSSSFPK
jgi:hypothetical protein